MKNSKFYRMFASLYLPLVLQNVLSFSVNLADNVMLGAYDETSLAGVAAVNQIQFVYQQLLIAIGEGLVIFASQYWGKKQIEPMKKITASAMHTALAAAILFWILASVVPGRLLSIFTSDPWIVKEGIRYLDIIRFTYLFWAVTITLTSALRSVEIVGIAFYLSVSTLFLNCGINYVLIYGRFGAPQLGVRGAAIGTLVARVSECLIVLWYVWQKECNLQLRCRDFFSSDPVLRKDYWKISLPMIFVQGLWGLNTALQTAILGHMKAGAIAANSAASTLFMLVKSGAIGACSTASVLIGKAVGEGNIAKVKRYAQMLQKMFLIIGVLSGVMLYFLRIPVLNLYDLTTETKQMTNAFLIILSVACVGMSYQMPVNNGIIRGGGHAMFVVKLDLISIWCMVIPLSFFMAFVVKASPAVVVCCLNADQIFKCIPAFWEVNYGNWIRKLTRE